MHEVALATSLARLVSRAATGRQVLTVRIEIGALRQVVPETMDYAWGFVTKGTPLEGAELSITWIPGRIRCANGHERELSGELDLLCRECDAATTIISGEEFRVIDIDVNS